MRKNHGKNLICCLVIGTMAAGLFSGCKGQMVDYGMEDTQALNGSKSGALTQFADIVDEKWRDNITTTDENGETLNVKISADITVLEAEQMSVVEIKEYEYTPENKKMVADAFFGDEIYSCLDSREYLEAWIGEDECMLEDIMAGDYTQWDHEDWRYKFCDENVKKINAELPILREYLQTAGSEFVKETDFTAERFLGKINDDYYVLSFQEIVGEKIINLEVCNVFLEEEEIESFGDGVMDYTRQQGLEMSEEMLEKAGFHVQLADSYITDLEEYDSVYSFVFSTEIVEGYNLADSKLESGNYTQEIDAVIANAYPMVDEIVFQISGGGYFDVWISCPIEVVSVTPDVPLLDFDNIKDIMIGEITDTWDLSYYNHTSEILLDQMDLTYFRVKDEEQEGYYSYVPVWRLSRSGFNTMILVNAIDGKVIDLKDVL